MHSVMKPRSVECSTEGCPSGSFSLLHTGSLEISQGDHQVFDHLFFVSKDFLPHLFSLAGRPALGLVLVVPNFFLFYFYLKITEATVLLGTFIAADFLPSPDLGLDTMLSLSFLWPHRLVFADMHRQL